jgi:hypothetical protein
LPRCVLHCNVTLFRAVFVVVLSSLTIQIFLRGYNRNNVTRPIRVANHVTRPFRVAPECDTNLLSLLLFIVTHYSGKDVSKDFSASDRKFAHNVGVGW